MNTKQDAPTRDKAQRLERRAALETIERRMELLTGADRVLMDAYVSKGLTLAELSVLMGVHRSTVSRRVKRIAERLSGVSRFARLPERGAALSDEEWQILLDYYVRGICMDKIAGARGVSYYHVREACKRAEWLVQVAGAISVEKESSE